MPEKNKVTQEEKAMAVLAYLWILVLIPLLIKKDSDFCRFHVKQGLVLFLASLGVMVLGMIPLLGWLIILPFGWLIITILSILGIINALQGKKWEMPYVGKYAEKIDL